MSDDYKELLIERSKRAKLNDIEFWEEVADNFSPEEIKELRKQSVKKEIVLDHTKHTVRDFDNGKKFKERDISPSTQDSYSRGAYLKHLEGTTGWDEESESMMEGDLLPDLADVNKDLARVFGFGDMTDRFLRRGRYRK